MRRKGKTSGKGRGARLLVAAVALLATLLASCDNLITRTPPMDVGGGYAPEANSAGSGALTVTASVSGGASRHAMPSLEVSDFKYAALLYPDGNPTDKGFVADTSAEEASTENRKLSFSFTRPEDPSGKTFTLEIFAFDKLTDEKDFSRTTAILSEKVTGLTVGTADALKIESPVALSANGDYGGKTGTVSLKVCVPADCTLEIDDTTNFVLTGESPDFTITQNGDGIQARAYPLILTVKKGDSTLYVLSEYINVLKGMCTNKWSDPTDDGARVIDEASFSTTVYVRGTGGWYDKTSPYKEGDTAVASNDNFGSFLAPLETIQKAVDKVLAMNDGKSPYTIYVDGTLTQSEDSTAYGMASFSALDKDLTLTIKALSGTATLKANGKSRVIYAPLAADSTLTLENITITGGNAGSDNGGGLYLNKGTVVMENCEVTGNEGNYGGGVYVYNSASTVEGGKIIGNEADSDGGGVYVQGGTFTIEGCTVSGNSAKDGGGIKLYTGTLTMTDCTIGGSAADSANTSTNGGGLYVSGTFTMKSGEIIGNTASNNGGGIYISSGPCTMIAGTIGKNTAEKYGGGVYITGGALTTNPGCTISGNTADRGGGVRVDGGQFTMSGGTIGGSDKNEALNGGGVYIGSTGIFSMSKGEITGNNATQDGGGGYVSGGEFVMSGGTVSGNTATNNADGFLVANSSKFTMSDSASVSEDNDVYISHTNGTPTITVAGALTAEKVATITPSSYKIDEPFLSSDDGIKLTQDICDQFAVTPKSGTVWKIAPSADGTQGVLKSISTVYLNSSSGSDANSGDKASKAVATLKKAVELTEEFSISEIIVCATYTLPSGEASLLNRAGGGKSDLTLVRYDGSSDVSDAFTGNLLEISQNVTIANVTLDGNKDNVTAEGSLLHVSGATVTLGSGTTITGNTAARNGSSSAVYGGGVYVENGGALILSEGCEISGNTATSNGNSSTARGGGVYVDGGTLTINGGTISGNAVSSSGAGAKSGGAGIYITGGTLTTSGGSISGNTASSSSTASSSDSDEDSDDAGEDSSSATASSSGGGICADSTPLTIKNCEIKNNKAGYGGAIYSKYGLVDLQGCVISGNTTGTSGTIYIGQTSAILTMSDVTIENNKATNGGGIFLGSNATARISDSSVVIKGNTASTSKGGARGAGISVWAGYLELSGSAKIEDVVGLYGGTVHQIRIMGELTNTGPIAKIALGSYTSGTKILTSDVVTITQDICNKFALYNSENRIVPSGDKAGVIE